MKLIYHPKKLNFRYLFKKYELDPSDETTLFLLPGVSVVQEIENFFCAEGVWGKNLLTFAELSDYVNEASPDLKKQKMSETRRLSLIRKASEVVSEKLEVFGAHSQDRDFLNASASIISKLKLNGVSPKKLADSSGRVRISGLREKLSDIGLVYKKYEELVGRGDFLDEADMLRAVSDELCEKGLSLFFPSAKRLAIFGFSDFTPRELKVIRSLSSAVSETFFFICDFDGLGEYESSFQDSFREYSPVFQEDFTMMKERVSAAAGVEFREFRDSHDEIEYVSRTIKKLIVDEGRKASDFKVVARSSQKRGCSIASVFERNGVALNLRNFGTLAESVYGHLACDILRLKSGNFRRNDLIALLLNPLFGLYLGESEGARRCVNRVRELSSADSKYTTASGISGWKRILEHLKQRDNGLSEAAGRIGSALDSVVSGFGRKSFAAMTSDLGKIFSKFRVSRSSERLIERNGTTRECFDEFFSFLRELSASFGEFDFRVGDPAEYLLFLNELMGKRVIHYKTPCDADSKRVSVIDFSAARGVSPKFLFLLGLSDVSFPPLVPADPVLKPVEKAEINRALGKRVFDGEGFHYEKEKHLFSALAEAASEKVFFSCFRWDQKSREVNRSDFLDETAGVSPERRVESFSEPGEIFSREDLLFHCFSPAVAGTGGRDISEISGRSYGFDIAGCLRRGISAERKRLALDGSYTEFEGVLRHPPRPDFFSPTALETYGTCPFMYFSQRLLRLRMARDPREQRASQLDLGSLAHEILKELMETIFAGEGSPQDTEHVLDAYNEIRKRHEVRAAAFFHLPEAVAEMEKKRFFDSILPGFISEDVRRIREDGFQPGFFEKEVEFSIGNTEIRGKIDRVDILSREAEGEAAVTAAAVVDYKIGSLNDKSYFDFRNLQLPLYLKALAERGFVPSRGSYLSIGRPEEKKSSSGNLFLDEAVSLARLYADGIRQGFFPPYVGKKVEGQRHHHLGMKVRPCSYCDYADLCRVKDGVTRETGGARR